MNKKLVTKAAFCAACCVVLVLAAGAGSRGKKDLKSIQFENSFFYDAGGNFLEEKGKDALIALMKYHGYPIYEGIRENLWVSDYGTGQYTKLGLGAWQFINNVEDKYMLMDLYLLPNQMLPEHWHLEGEGNPAKREGWLIRYGSSHVVGIGEPNLSDDVVIPECHQGGTAITAHEVFCKPGEFAKLERVQSKHWQFAGPEGAIITEVANCHTDSAVRHTDKGINDNFLGL